MYANLPNKELLFFKKVFETKCPRYSLKSFLLIVNELFTTNLNGAQGA